MKFKERAKRTEMKKRNKVSSTIRKRAQAGRRVFNKYDRMDNGSRPMEEMMSDIQRGVAVPSWSDSLSDPRALTDLLLQSSSLGKAAEEKAEASRRETSNGKKGKGGANTSRFPLSYVDETTTAIQKRLSAIEEREHQRRQEESEKQTGGVNKNHYRHRGQNYIFWERVGLHPRLLKALRELHFTHPTPVQEEVLPTVLGATLPDGTTTPSKRGKKGEDKKKDVVVSAETGSGKTLVFALPILQDLLIRLYGEEAEKDSTKKRSREAEKATVLSQEAFDARTMHSLIISPTRELALQINAAIQQLTRFAPDITVGCVVGGMAAEKQQRILNRHPHILICTPGRLWDLSQKNEGCYLGHSISRRLHFVVLDEADKMLQSGKFEELRQLLERIHCEILPAGFVQEREEGAEAGEMPVAEGRWDAEKQKFVPFTEEELKERQAKKNNEPKPNKSKKAEKDEEEVADDEEEEEEEGEEDDNEEEEEEGEEEEEREEEETAEGEPVKKGKRDLPRTIPMPPEPSPDHRVITYVTSATLSLQTNYERRDYKSSKSVIRTSNADVMGKVLQQLEIKPQHASVFTLSQQADVVAKVNETYLRCPEKSKDLYLYYFLQTFKNERAVVFVNAISMLRRLVKILGVLGISTVGLHASMQQRQRLKYMDKFKTGEIRVLVATDVASRGLDIEGLRYVLHYQVPRSTDAYIHRCGRTARCGGAGLSLLLVNPQEHVSFKKLMESLGRKETDMETFALQPTVVHQLHVHLRIALQIDKLQKEIDKSRAKNHWVTRMSKGAELDVDDMIDKEADAENREKEKAIRLLQKELNLLVQKFGGTYGGKGAFRTGAQSLGAKYAEEKLRDRADRQTVRLTSGGGEKKGFKGQKDLTVYDVVMGKSEASETEKKTKKNRSKTVGESENAPAAQRRKKIKFE